MTASRSKNRPQWARDIQSRIVSLWIEAQRDGLTHEAILSRYTAITRDNPHWGQLTSAERMETFAAYKALSDYTYRTAIVWRLGPASGPLSEELQGKWGEDSELSRLCRIPGALFGAHFWKGTDKPYNDYTSTNESPKA